MAAGMHAPLMLGLIAMVMDLRNGQAIHIGPQADGLGAGDLALNDRDNPGLA